MKETKRVVVYDENGEIIHDSIPELGYYVAINDMGDGNSEIARMGFGKKENLEKPEYLIPLISNLETQVAKLKTFLHLLALTKGLKDICTHIAPEEEEKTEK